MPPHFMSPTIRAASLQGFAPLVAELGGDPQEYFSRFGIDPRAADSPDTPVSITAHDRMIDAASAELGCRDLGLRMAQAQDVTVLGPLAVAISASATLRVALRVAARFLFVHSPALEVDIVPDPSGRPEVVAVTYRKDLRESPYSRQGIELGIGLMFEIATLLIDDRRGLRSIDFPHAPVSPIGRYAEFFGTAVRFNRRIPAMRLDRAMLDRPLRAGNDPVRKLAIEHLARTFPEQSDALFARRVRHVVSESLGAQPSLAYVAAVLVMHPRTLQRHLREEGTTFDAIRDAVRRDCAYRLIVMEDLPFADVAQIVGFGEQSSLTHAVRRWFGASPRDMRSADSRGARGIRTVSR